MLSGIPEANVQIESVSDVGDMSFNLTRDAMSRLVAKPLAAIKALLEKVLVTAGVTSADISAVEITGGGVRMQVVQAIIHEVLSASTSPGTNALALGAKLDDGSIALGAALVCNKLYANEDEVPQPVPDSPTPLGMSSEALVTSSTKGYSESDLKAMREEESLCKTRTEKSQCYWRNVMKWSLICSNVVSTLAKSTGSRSQP